jgi:hypothetical protein
MGIATNVLAIEKHWMQQCGGNNSVLIPSDADLKMSMLATEITADVEMRWHELYVDTRRPGLNDGNAYR